MQALLLRNRATSFGPLAWLLAARPGACAPGFAEESDSTPFASPPKGADKPASAPPSAPSCGALARTFCAWNGASGERYMCSVFAIDDFPLFSDAVVLAVRQGAGGEREIVAAMDSGALPEQLLAGPLLGFIRSRHATQWHIHLLCNSADERRAAITDLLEAQAGS